MSDPVDFAVDPLSLVSVSLYLPDITPTTTMHWDGHQTAFVAAGDKVGDVDFKADSKQTQRVFLTRFSSTPRPARAPSSRSATRSPMATDRRWTAMTVGLTVSPSGGESGRPADCGAQPGHIGRKGAERPNGCQCARSLRPDILSQPKADTVILMMGINDIGWPGSGLALHDPEPTAADIIEGYKQLIDRAHVHGMKIIGATLTPFDDAFAARLSRAITRRTKRRSASR